MTTQNSTKTDQAYDQALADWRAASRSFTAVRGDYRARAIGDAEFLVARAAFDAASIRFDAAEDVFIAAKNAPQ